MAASPCIHFLVSSMGLVPVAAEYAKPPKTEAGKRTAAILPCFSTSALAIDILRQRPDPFDYAALHPSGPYAIR